MFKTRIHWDISEITSLASLEGKTVADIGAGSGRISFLVAPLAHTVYAVEPLSSFRNYRKEKAAKMEMHHLFVMDGTLDSIPLPESSVDLLITSNAIGWNLSGELKEIERVVRPGGTAIHLLHTEEQAENLCHEILISAPWNYHCIQHAMDQRIKIKYYKLI